MSAAPSTPIGRERLLWTAGIAIGASLPHWPQLPAWVLALLCACVAWRLVAAWIAWPLPPKAVQIVLAALAFAGVLMQYGTINGVGAGSALLVVMVALKFLELRGHRDQLVLMIVAYFLMFASLLYERSLLVAAYLLVFVWITTVGLLQLGRRGTLLPNRVTAKLSGRLLLHALPLMLVLFVLFPRLPGPLWGVPGSTSSGATGLSDTMSPGDITELGLSDAVAFRVEFLSRPPIPSELYWRGPVMTNYNGRTWSRQQGMRRVGRSIADTIDYRGEPTEYHVTLEPNGRPWAFALDMPQRWSSDRNLRMGSDYQLGFSFAGPVASRVDYEVTSYTAYEAREPLSASELKTFLSLPEGGNPRTRALVAEWTRDHPAVEQLIERAFNFFRSQPFFYTLTPPALGANPSTSSCSRRAKDSASTTPRRSRS